MEIPTEAVNTLSDTAWGAILLLTVFSMGAAIAYLALYVRNRNKIIEELGEKRVQDSKDMYEKAEKLTRESLTTVEKACRAIDDLGRKIAALEVTISRFRAGGP